MQKKQGFTLLELLIVVVILGVLALIAAPSLLNAADRAKEGTVKANVSAAASTATSKLALNDNNTAATTLAGEVITDLNDGGNNKNPFDVNAAPFADAAAAGAVVVTGDDAANSITVTGYAKDGTTVLITKTVNAPGN